MRAARLRRQHGARIVAALLATTASAALPAAVSASGRQDIVLSNETTHTTWTVASATAPIRALPADHARILGHLRFQTPDGFLQSYVLLRERLTNDGATWVQLRIPTRPNGQTGWVPLSALESFEVVHTQIVVDRAARTLTLYRNGRRIFRAPVGVGKPSTPTPPGHFWVTEEFPSSDAFYGPFLMATSDYSVLSEWPGGGIVGIHGTNEPQLVPGDPSHGCIRMHNTDITRLARLVPIGTPILVR